MTWTTRTKYAWQAAVVTVAIAMIGATAMAESIQVTAGTTGTLGKYSVGVRSVADAPERASILLFGSTGGTPWELIQDVARGQHVVVGGASFLVSGITGPAAGSRGGVDFASDPAAPGAAYPDDAVVLVAGGKLRLDGPELDTASDLRVIAWQPGENGAVAAQAEWWPARMGRDHTDAADVHTLRLAPGERVTVGRASASVLAVEGASPDHAARVVFRLLPR